MADAQPLRSYVSMVSMACGSSVGSEVSTERAALAHGTAASRRSGGVHRHDQDEDAGQLRVGRLVDQLVDSL